MQELVKLHGGMVTAESRIGEGTTFIVTLRLGSAHLPADQIVAERALVSNANGAAPFVEEALRWLPDGDEDSTPAPSCSRSGTKPWRSPRPEWRRSLADDRPRVLVADDNADMRRYLVRLLAEHYRVKAVADGEAALASVRRRPWIWYSPT